MAWTVLRLHTLLRTVTTKCNFQKTVRVQHTQTYIKLTRTHTHSLQRNEDKGLWRPWLAVLFVKIEPTHLHMHANKRRGPWIRLQRHTDGEEKTKRKKESDRQGRKLLHAHQPNRLPPSEFPFNRFAL